MKTTRANFTLFKKECKKYIDLFGLNNWEVIYRHEALGDARATCTFDSVGKVVVLSLTTDFDKVEDLEFEIKKCAYHECLELLLAPLCDMASSRDWNFDNWMSESHSIIRTLENVYFKGKD